MCDHTAIIFPIGSLPQPCFGLCLALMKTVQCEGDEQLKWAKPDCFVPSADFADTVSVVVLLARRTGSLCVCVERKGAVDSEQCHTCSQLGVSFRLQQQTENNPGRVCAVDSASKHTPDSPLYDQNEFLTDRTRGHSDSKCLEQLKNVIFQQCHLQMNCNQTFQNRLELINSQPVTTVCVQQVTHRRFWKTVLNMTNGQIIQIRFEQVCDWMNFI